MPSGPSKGANSKTTNSTSKARLHIAAAASQEQIETQPQVGINWDWDDLTPDQQLLVRTRFEDALFAMVAREIATANGQETGQVLNSWLQNDREGQR